MNLRTPSLPQFKQWSRSSMPLAKAVLAARVFAQMERARVDAYVKPIFDSFKFQYCGELADKCKLSGPLPSMNELYLCDDPLVQAFYDDCDKAHREHGFTGPSGHCPALVAENIIMVAERHLIESATHLCGIESNDVFGNDRRKYLEILLGACFAKQRAA